MAKQSRSNGNAPGQVNMIGDGTVLEGTLQSEGDVRISGKLIGKLKVTGKVSIAPEGAVEGEIHASSADVSGRIEGEVHIEERLLLRSTANVEGNIQTARLVMEEGATFNGRCQMGTRTIERGKAPGEAAAATKPAADAKSGNGKAQGVRKAS